MDPVAVLAAAGITWLTWRVLRGGFAIKPGQVKTNLSGSALLLAVLSLLAGVLIAGPVFGPAIVAGIALHEFGHVAAYRAMGHDDARFRMIPFLGGVAISERLPKDQLTDFYVLIMGPGIMLAPLAISAALMTGFRSDPLIFSYAQALFLVTGAINFFNLLPLWPLDGGRIVRVITCAFSPMLSRYATIGMSIALGLWAFWAKLPLILVVAMLGFSSARRIAALNRMQPAMSRPEAVQAAFAYLTAMAAHGLAGAPLLETLAARMR